MNAESAAMTAPAQRLDRYDLGSRAFTKQKLRLLVYALLASLDGAAIVAAFCLASIVRLGDPFASETLAVCGVTLATFLGVSLNSGAYSAQVLDRSRLGIRRALMSLVFATSVTALAAFFFKGSGDYSRSVVAGGALLGIVFLACGRLAFAYVVKQALNWRPIEQIVLVDGVRPPPPGHYEIVVAGEVGLRADPGDPLVLDRLARTLAGKDRVVIVCDRERRGDWALILKGANIDGFVVAPELDHLGLIDIDQFAGSSLLRISCGPLDLPNRALKRGLDVSCALFALVFLAPLLLLTALAIKLDSPGPVFFRQERVGRGNRLFRILKFRSMRNELCDGVGVRSTQRDDERITRVGKLIRASSIDELPQLFNVLAGDMSFVGPRPHALGSTAGDQLFWEVDRRYWDRHATKPGITGLAQVRGLRGATHHRSDLEHRLQADLEYLAGWTIWRDVAILLRTMRVLVHKNAF